MSKLLFNMDCPICGFQRALLLLFKGEFLASFYMYPPLLPVLVLMGLGLFKLVNGNGLSATFLTRYFYLTVGLIGINYVFKLVTGGVVN